MVAPTSAGVRRRVAMETASITVKASGTVQAAGWVVSVSGQPRGLDLTRGVPVILIPGMQGYQLYMVVKGDTLTKIASELGSTVETISAANRLSDPNKIRIGQILRVSV